MGKKKDSTGTPKVNDKEMQLLAERDTAVADQENGKKKQKKKKHSKDNGTSEDQTDQVPSINEKQKGKKSTKGCEDEGSSFDLDITEHANEKSKKKKRKAAEAFHEDLPGELASPQKKRLLKLPCASSDNKNLTPSPQVERKSKKAKKEKEVEESDVKKTDDCRNEKQNDDGLEEESFILTKNSHQKKKDKERRKKKKSKAENEGSFSDDEPEKKVIVAEECNETSEKKQKDKYNNDVIQALKESDENPSIFHNVEGIDSLDNIACKKKKNKDRVHYLPVCYDHAEENCEERNKQKKQNKKETIERKETDQIHDKSSSKERKSKKKKANNPIEADITDSPKSLDGINCVETEQKKTNKRKKLEPTVTEETKPKLELSSDCGETKEKHKMKKKSKKYEESVHKLEPTVKEETIEPKLELSSDCGERKEKHKMKKRSKKDEESIDNKLDESPTATIPSSVAIKAGQWNTSTMFESDARQEKFLRLLGSFRKANENTANGSPTSENKKGLFGSLKAKSGGQSALTYQAAQLVEKRLESDFEKALGFRGQRGVGLGFTPDPAEGKKFHININKTSSKKFDD